MLENIQFQLLLATFAGWVGRQQAVVITYLIEENRVSGRDSATTIGRPHEGVVRIFGHYERVNLVVSENSIAL